MTMEADVLAVLTPALAPVPVAWGISGREIDAPRVVLTRISGALDHDQSGPTKFQRARVQVDAYAKSYRAVLALATSIRSALDGARGGKIRGAFLDNEHDLHPDIATGDLLFRRSLDFIINHEEL